MGLDAVTITRAEYQQQHQHKPTGAVYSPPPAANEA
jgi:hypothetical protein